MTAPANEKKFGISVIPGDGIGNEVVPEGPLGYDFVSNPVARDYRDAEFFLVGGCRHLIALLCTHFSGR